MWIGATVAALSSPCTPFGWRRWPGSAPAGRCSAGCSSSSVLAYVIGWERGRAAGRIPAAWLVGALVLFAASLLARATGLVLPVVLVVLDVYPLRRLGGGPGRWLGPPVWRVWVEKIGFGALALLAVPMAYLARGDEVGEFWQFGYEPAIALAWGVYSVGFYVRKTARPGGLEPPLPHAGARGPMVPRRAAERRAWSRPSPRCWSVLRRRWPGALTAWIVYGVVLAPLSGILPFGRLRGVADRYTYARASGGPWWRAAPRRWAGGRSERGRLNRVWAGAIGGGDRGHPGRLERAELEPGKDLAERRDALGMGAGVHRDSPVVQNNLGWAWAHAGEFQRAEAHVRRAAQAWPHNPAVLQTLGRIVAAQRTLRGVGLDPPPRGPGRAPLAGGTDRSRLRPLRERRDGPGGGAPRARGPARPRRGAGPRLPRPGAHGRRAAQEAEAHLRRAAELDGASPPDEPPGAAKGGPRTPPHRREPVGGGVRPYRRRAGAGGTPGRGLVTPGPRAGRSR